MQARHRARSGVRQSIQRYRRVFGKRDVQPRHALLPGSAGDRAALFAGAAGAGFSPPHGQLKKVIRFQISVFNSEKNLPFRDCLISMAAWGIEKTVSYQRSAFSSENQPPFAN